MGFFLDLFGLQEKPTSFQEREQKRDKEQAKIYRERKKEEDFRRENPRQHGGTKPKRDKSGAHQFDYFGVSPSEFMQAMTSGKYQGKKISRAGSSITEQGFMTHYTLARPIPKSERYVR